jgi:hypothetical protein
MSIILNYLSNPIFKNLTVSILSIFITMTIKVLCRKDSNFKYTWNDLSIGFNLIVSAIVFSLNSILDILLKNKDYTVIESAVLWIIMCKIFTIFFHLFLTTALMVIIRKFGWQEENNTEPRLLTGVIFPVAVGLFTLLVSLNI